MYSQSIGHLFHKYVLLSTWPCNIVLQMGTSKLHPTSKISDDAGITRIPEKVREILEVKKGDQIRYGQDERGRVLIEKVEE